MQGVSPEGIRIISHPIDDSDVLLVICCLCWQVIHVELNVACLIIQILILPMSVSGQAVRIAASF